MLLISLPCIWDLQWQHSNIIACCLVVYRLIGYYLLPTTNQESGSNNTKWHWRQKSMLMTHESWVMSHDSNSRFKIQNSKSNILTRLWLDSIFNIDDWRRGWNQSQSQRQCQCLWNGPGQCVIPSPQSSSSNRVSYIVYLLCVLICLRRLSSLKSQISPTSPSSTFWKQNKEIWWSQWSSGV